MSIFNLLSNSQVEVLQSNSEALGVSTGVMIGLLLDDEFGGLSVGSAEADSFQSIQHHVDTLEGMLRDLAE